MRRALITGITGQDGAYLAQLLLNKGYEVYGGYRRTANPNTHRLASLGIEHQVKMVPLELLEQTNLFRVVEEVEPDEVYNLAAQSQVGISFEQPVFTADVTALGAARLLEVIRTINPRIKYYQASSSEMFGKAPESPQNEQTAFRPRSPYAVSKVFAHQLTVNYRESYNIFACCGILFNHESPFRGLDFVTRKITHTAAQIKLGLQDRLLLGNLEARRDWGYAPEYVEATWRMLQQPEPDDYVIATGEAHSVKEFAELAFSHLELDFNEYVESSAELYRPTDVECLVGDFTKAKEQFGWEPRTSFSELVRIMVEADLQLIQQQMEAQSL